MIFLIYSYKSEINRKMTRAIYNGYYMQLIMVQFMNVLFDI